MKQIFNKISIILLLIILIFVINNLFVEPTNILMTPNNHINASFSSDEYIKHIKNTPHELQKYKNGLFSNNQRVEQFVSNTEPKQPKFLKKIDKILYINLNHRKDRLKQINEEFTKMGFPSSKIKRIDAVHEKYNGHIGCCKSHINVMNEIINNDYEYTMVFEDDFVFSVDKKTLDSKMNTFFKEYNDNWDIIQLASVYTTLDDTKVDYIKKVNKASTSSAYIINRPFAKTLLMDLQQSLALMMSDMQKFNKSNNKLKKKHITNHALDQHWYGLQKKSRWFLFKPYIGKQGGDAGYSSIMSSKLEGFTSNRKRIFKLTC
jgi:glycosyl transferase family 25